MAITLSPMTLPNGTKGSAYSQTITASGGTGPYTYAVTSGALPAGLSLSSGGVLSGTPTTPGYSSFTVTATDSVPATGAQAYSFYVSGVLYWFICTNAAYPSAVPVVAGSQANFNRQAANAIAGLNKTRHEVGSLLVRPTADPVNNHLLCDGTAIDRTAFPQLFAMLGTSWGAGNGTTTFNIPNLIAQAGQPAALPIAITAPVQTVAETTVSTTDTVIVEPTAPTETGGGKGGNIISGGRYHLNNSF
jgi:hypothetical protein